MKYLKTQVISPFAFAPLFPNRPHISEMLKRIHASYSSFLLLDIWGKCL